MFLLRFPFHRLLLVRAFFCYSPLSYFFHVLHPSFLFITNLRYLITTPGFSFLHFSTIHLACLVYIVMEFHFLSHLCIKLRSSVFSDTQFPLHSYTIFSLFGRCSCNLASAFIVLQVFLVIIGLRHWSLSMLGKSSSALSREFSSHFRTSECSWVCSATVDLFPSSTRSLTACHSGICFS